ncbi:class I adenylate-forming enzyme family protein [Halalkalibacterium halodurans]|uniref:Long-chain acyl-CoA synthetase (Ligase) n=1 Tax=Halalkalibacterium halodurans (strain ATCC BAA-125 / DSM 18197 / FERM 7344 / JCM 9153 / C-125) TaxID=272558 RepID=Q9KBC2_HALH5|nr:class I adenylate-forming enzyme family protein [Halalkalibacterium halodurans]MDY7222565.1 class I adenylate-forming enzyme family protein [Halalkalibacterium halodurans]MDY7241786.1 class I adenylate-forming enzyme family protein [Halalkalibacterium halodurans]MED4123960.1 class I adenylate-forming enzyme family protein [Halalkalibacterium halodurans]BAB05725.1 long-chain acyl-CoA synthetase (ligase) [Halalkalibacterium halodurans C-125]
MLEKDYSVFPLLYQAVQANPKKEALYDLNERITYEQLLERVNELAAIFIEMGVVKGDRIGVCLPNWNETVIIFFAAAKLGATVVPFNPNYREYEIAYIVANAAPKLLFVCEKVEENVGLAALVADQRQLISVRFKSPFAIPFEQLKRTNKSAIDVSIVPSHERYCILYTSGTTGLPKGVMITHSSVVQSGLALARSLKCTKDDVFIVPAPLFHIFGMACNLMAAVSCQAKVILQEKFKPDHTLALIEQEKVTIHQAVPTMFILELNHPDFSTFDLSSLRAGMVGAAPCPKETVQEIRKRMGFHLCISYGMTEVGAATITPYEDEDESSLDTVGKPMEGVEITIVNEDREPLPVGDIGEIAIRGFGNMIGYYKLPEQTNEVLGDNGWFYTGDLGSLDEEGYLRFIGRKKELIIRGGYNIYPQEIEAILSEHEKVQESAVIGLPDEVLGELVCAGIKLKQGAHSSEQELLAYLSKRIAHYKVPSKIVFVEELPVTASGKVQKSQLREQIIETIKS